MSTPRELLTFPGLRAGRPRAPRPLRRRAASSRARYDDLEQVSPRGLAAQALRRAGSGTTLWRPLLDSKFDGRYDDLPATYLWARSRRMSGTRDRSSREVMGTIDGGYQVLVDALADAIRAARRRGPDLDPASRFVPSSQRPRLRRRARHGHARRTTRSSRRCCALATSGAARPATCWPRSGPDPTAATSASSASWCACGAASARTTRVNITDRSRPAHDGRGDDARRRPRARRRHADLRRPSTSTRTARSSSAPRATSAASTSATCARMFPALRRGRRAARAGRPRPRRRAGPRAGRRGAPRPRTSSRRPASPPRPRPHVYPELVNGQAVLGVAERLADGLLERLGAATAEAAGRGMRRRLRPHRRAHGTARRVARARAAAAPPGVARASWR